jgi:hypothetical protein
MACLAQKTPRWVGYPPEATPAIFDIPRLTRGKFAHRHIHVLLVDRIDRAHSFALIYPAVDLDEDDE